jgi:hypothetical protein
MGQSETTTGCNAVEGAKQKVDITITLSDEGVEISWLRFSSAPTPSNVRVGREAKY